MNNILARHEGNKYEEFSVCLNEFHFPPEQSFGFISRKKKFEAMSFNYMVNFWTTEDENGSVIWTATQDKISILYYFNDENIDLESILSLLNNFAITYILDTQGWKLPFTITVSNSEHWSYDYFERIEFICRK